MELGEKHCIPCEGQVVALDERNEETLIKQIAGWELKREDMHKISKTVKTEKFMEAVDLLRTIAEIAESEGHHPNFHLYYNKLNIEFYTHKAKGLTENDFIMAAKINESLRKRGLQ